MSYQKFIYWAIGAPLIMLSLVGCGAQATNPTPVLPTPTPVPPTPTPVPPTPTPMPPTPTLEPTVEPTESAPIGATILLLGSDGSYIDLYPQPSSPLAAYLQVPAGVECEVLSGPRTITDITLWEIDCSWSDECCGEGYGLWGWVDITNLEVLD
jgi:hypothetical protein